MRFHTAPQRTQVVAAFQTADDAPFGVALRHAQGRIVSCLEGGYNLSALGRSVEAHLRVLADV